MQDILTSQLLIIVLTNVCQFVHLFLITTSKTMCVSFIVTAHLQIQHLRKDSAQLNAQQVYLVILSPEGAMPHVPWDIGLRT